MTTFAIISTRREPAAWQWLPGSQSHPCANEAHYNASDRLTLAESTASPTHELLGTLSEQADTSRKALRVSAQATLPHNFQISFLEPLLGRDDVELNLCSALHQNLVGMLTAHRLDEVLANVPRIATRAAPGNRA